MALAIALGLFVAANSPDQAQTAQGIITATPTRTPTPDATPEFGYADPMEDSAAAIDSCLRFYPDGLAPSQQEAKIVSIGTAHAWLHQSSMFPSLQSPAWIVALTGAGVTEDNVLSRTHADQAPGSVPVAVEGVFCVIDANSGATIAVGALGSQWDQSHMSFANLVSEPIDIVPATVPIQPTADETPATEPPPP